MAVPAASPVLVCVISPWWCVHRLLLFDEDDESDVFVSTKEQDPTNEKHLKTLPASLTRYGDRKARESTSKDRLLCKTLSLLLLLVDMFTNLGTQHISACSRVVVTSCTKRASLLVSSKGVHLVESQTSARRFCLGGELTASSSH